MHTRLFVAIPLPLETRKMLSDFAKQVTEKSGPEDHLRYTAAENLHITVCFIGTVDNKNVKSIADAVERTAAGTGDFSLGNSRITFMPVHRPRMVWCAFGPSKHYAALVGKITEKLKTKGAPVHGFDDRPFKESIPHITIIRGQRISDPVRKWITGNPFPEISVPVRSYALYSSVLHRSGPVYEEIRRFTP